MKYLILLLFTSICMGQSITLEGGYFDKHNLIKANGLQMLVGGDIYYQNIGASLKYRNLTNKGQFYEGKLHYMTNNKDVNFDISGGTSYEYARGLFRPIIGGNVLYRIHPLVEFTIGIDHIFSEAQITSMTFGTRIKLSFNRDPNKIRFF